MARKNPTQSTYKICCPATRAIVGEYPLMSPQEVDLAVCTAREVFGTWSESPIKQRQQILRRAAAVLAENAECYAAQIAAENGKTPMDALLADIFSTAHLLSHYAKKLSKTLAPVHTSGTLMLPGRKTYYTFEPKGVVAVIAPWNYPFTLSAGPVISAVAAGNTVVLKPSSQTTQSGLLVKEILDKAGLPENVVQVVTGSGSVTGDALASHPDLDMLFFTGSTQVGIDINVKAAGRLIPTIMELGGKDVAIVTKNADLSRAADGINFGAFTNGGQTCIGTEIILVDRAVYDPFLKKLSQRINSHRLGKGCGEIGAMTMESQLHIVRRQLEDALEKGAVILAGGPDKISCQGLFFPPTLLGQTTPDMLVRQEETFGPLKCVIAFDTPDEAIALANASEYGLSGSVYTKDMREGRCLARRLHTGSVNINDTLVTYAVPSLPFGGVKKSGTGNYHGEVGLRAFCNIKSITEFSWRLKREFYWYPVPPAMEQAFPHALRMLFSTGASQKIRAGLLAYQAFRQGAKNKG